MNITFISDTHGKHSEITQDLQGGDILIHCGDSMNTGYYTSELTSFLDWFDSLDIYTHKIFIAGNHCRLFENNPQQVQEILIAYTNITYLQDSAVVIEGLKIYGSPWQPWFYDWAFNLPRNGKELQEKWSLIPYDTDILVTHSPLFGVLDKVKGGEHVGCEKLLERAKKLKHLKIHAYGHIHEAFGQELINGVHNINASVLNERYEYTNKPINIEL